MTLISKSLVIAHRQCPRRAWLSVHNKELEQGTGQTLAVFRTGHTAGDLARRLLATSPLHTLVDLIRSGRAEAEVLTRIALAERHSVFEATLRSDDVIAALDILNPWGEAQWSMIEVKSSTKVKDVYLEDAAFQFRLAQRCGIQIEQVAVAVIDSSWTYRVTGQYEGLFKQEDVTEQIVALSKDVDQWVDDVRATLSSSVLPEVKTGPQCHAPYECGFLTYCAALEPQAEFPVSWLPRLDKKKSAARGWVDMREVPESELSELQRLVRDCTVNHRTVFDQEGAKGDLAGHGFPAYFLDFESIQFGVPVWTNTSPYQQVCFQYSLHVLHEDQVEQHFEFLSLSGDDPSRPLAEQLLLDCGEVGPIYVYNKQFEDSRLKELAERFADLRAGLEAIRMRLIDLMPIARKRYYSPAQHGSWSIKKVIEGAFPDLSYSDLVGVQNGTEAQIAYNEASTLTCPSQRVSEIRAQLLEYCKRDTWVMVKLWQFFQGLHS